MVKHALVTDIDSLPLILKIPEILGLFRISESKLRHQLQDGTFRPAPWALFPYRWRRQDVIDELQRRRSHGPHLHKTGT